MSVLILGETTDSITDTAVAWLNYYGCDYVRINTPDFRVLNVFIKNEKLKIEFTDGECKYILDDFNQVWCRRGSIEIKLPNINKFNIRTSFKPKIHQHLNNEANTLKDFISNRLQEMNSINSPNKYNLNKLEVLKEARELGLRIPDTYISEQIKKTHIKENLITKNIQDVLILTDEFSNIHYGQSTKKVEENAVRPSFFLSLFQREIKKKVELRIFFLDEMFFASAIFSQSKKSTKVDFRNNEINKPNRVVPYSLPYEIKLKLKKLCKRLNIRSGSIDIIVSPGCEYYFLEINPVGQLDWVNKLCNFYIEKEISKTIINGS
ncbi:MAG: grasp-with-spasm system ATP-grasp peptide maturase [Candidatus Paceibacterota bacterium]